MSESGTIYADGRVKLHGTVPSDTRLMGITRSLIAIKHPGGRWWNNGGEQYTSAWIEIRELESLSRANEPAQFIFRIKRGGLRMDFHPTPKRAQAEAADSLDEIAAFFDIKGGKP